MIRYEPSWKKDPLAGRKDVDAMLGDELVGGIQHNPDGTWETMVTVRFARQAGDRASNYRQCFADYAAAEAYLTASLTGLAS